MRRAIARLPPWVQVLPMLGAVWGCAGSSDYMRAVATPAPIGATADKSTVVFVRPSGIAFGVNFAILDQQGHWIGDAVAQSHFAVQLPPGEYMFVALSLIHI